MVTGLFKYWLWRLAQQSRYARKLELPRVLPPCANRLAYREYVPQVYPGRLTLFRARDAGDPPDQLLLGWGKLVLGGIEIHDVPGYHDTLLREPHVRILVERLRMCLDRSQQTRACLTYQQLTTSETIQN